MKKNAAAQAHAVPAKGHLFERVADQMEVNIGGDGLKPGYRLPSERAMAAKFKVSRAVIREAIRILCERGLLEARPKSGVYVKELDGKGASAQIGRLLKQQVHAFEELGEVRFTLEVDIAGLAATRATFEEIETLEKIVARMEERAQDSALFSENDLLFHTTLARATHNRLFLVLMEPIQDLLMSYRVHSYRRHREPTIAAALHHHRRILETIKSRDPEAARQAMREHLLEAQSIMVRE
jgi:GntR family transcriptional repressor for pyruvate dehydrogenase complex